METKRITLDLTKIFKDYRKRAFVMIRPDWKNIECLQTHILNLFGLEHFVYLTDPDGVVFPAAERVDVIKNNEVVMVHRINLDKMLEPNPVVLDSDSDDTLEEEVKNTNGAAKQKPVKSKSSSPLKKHGAPLESDSDEKYAMTASDFDEMIAQIKRTGAPPSALTETPTKRRRKRVRKSKAKDPKKDPQPSTSNVQTLKANIFKPSATWLNDSKNKHVRFSDNASSSTSGSSESDSSDVEVTKVCKYTSETQVASRKVPIMIRFWDNQTQSYGTEAAETPSQRPSATNTELDRPRIPNLRLDIPPAVVPTIGPTLPSNISTDHLSEAEVPTVPPANTPTTALPIGPNTDTLEELRKEIEQLNLPLVEYGKLKVHDTIAFKLLRMDDQCQPTVSGYIIGCVEKVSDTSGEMSIRLLAGKGEIGSWICRTVMTDNEIETIEDDCINVTFKELYEPRCCLLTL